MWANIQCADILQVIWPNTNTNTDIYFHRPNSRDHQLSSVLELAYSNMVHTLITFVTYVSFSVQNNNNT